MPDAKIITYGAQISAGTTSVPDNTSVALDIESTDGNDYINIDTTDGSESLSLITGVSTAKVGINRATPASKLTVQGNGTSSETVVDVYATAGDVVCKIGTVNTNGGSFTLFRGGSVGVHLDVNSGYVFNEGGLGSADLRAESNNNTHMLFVDASADAVGFNKSDPTHAVDVTGTAGLSTGTAWTNTSDSRIKTDVQNIEDALDKVKLLRPVSFFYTEDYLRVHPEIDGKKRYNSFIAQEYGKVFPDAVSNGGDLTEVISEAVRPDPENGIDGSEEVRKVLLSDVQQFTPHDLNMYLVRAIQELSAKVESLESQIANPV